MAFQAVRRAAGAARTALGAVTDIHRGLTFGNNCGIIKKNLARGIISMWIIIVIAVVVVFAIVYFAMLSRGIKNNDRQLTQNGFSTTRCFGMLRVDDKNHKWCINNGFGEIKIYDFSEVVDCKIEENSVLNKVNKLGVYIYTLNGGAIYVPLISTETKRDSFSYNSSINMAQQMCSAFYSMKAQPAAPQIPSVPTVPVPTNSVTNNALANDLEEQLKKLKSMADSGLITHEDFEAKKKQLLGL